MRSTNALWHGDNSREDSTGAPTPHYQVPGTLVYDTGTWYVRTRCHI